MILGVDVGGTKTLVAGFVNDSPIPQFSVDFRTSESVEDLFSEVFAQADKHCERSDITAISVAMPGIVNPDSHRVSKLGHRDWHEVDGDALIKRYVDCPVFMDNDANLGALSEAIDGAGQNARHVLYLTISTGIGSGFVWDKVITPSMSRSEAGHMVFMREGVSTLWEDFASGSAFVQRFGVKAEDMTDDATWQLYAQDIALGLVQLIAMAQPHVIVIGGSVGAHFEKYEAHLQSAVAKLCPSYLNIPPIMQASYPTKAVIRGCFYASRDAD